MTTQKIYQLPVEITEYDLNTRDDKAQGEFTRDIVTAWFAHPQSKGFTMWGFWEGRHWRPRAALLRKDWSLKPNGSAYLDLVFGEWWTDVRGESSADGKFAVRGFKGTYLVEVTSGGFTKSTPATLTGEGTTLIVTLP